MAKSRKKTSTLSDLEPVTLDKTEAGAKEADSVKGGKPTGTGSPETYFVMTMKDATIT